MFVQLTKDFLGRKAGERIDVSEGDGGTLVAQGVATAVTDDVLTPAVSKAVEGAFARFSAALDGMLETSLRQVAAAQGRSRKHAAPILFGPEGGDPRGKSFGDWLLCVRRGDTRTLAEKYDSHFADWDQKAALNTATGTQGGYTVPGEFVPQLLEAARETALVRPRATVLPMASRSVQVPALDVVTAPSAGDTAFFGGLAARWTEEAASLTETEPTFKQIELVAHQLSGYSKISNELLMDNAIGLEALLVRLFGGAIAWFEDYAFLRGDGVGKPLGAVGAAAGWAKSVSRNTANDFKIQDAASMLGALLPGFNPKTTCWAVSPTVLPKLIQMTSAAAGVGFVDNLRDRPRLMLLGLPVEVTEKLPALGTARDVLLCDFQHYLIGDRQQVEIAFSEHVAFLNNQGTWRFVCRVDGQPWLRATVTLSDGSSTVSPFVYLS